MRGKQQNAQCSDTDQESDSEQTCTEVEKKWKCFFSFKFFLFFPRENKGITEHREESFHFRRLLPLSQFLRVLL